MQRQDVGAAVNASSGNYPMSEMRASLQRVLPANTADAGEGIILEYKNGWSPADRLCRPIACNMHLLRPLTRRSAPPCGAARTLTWSRAPPLDCRRRAARLGGQGRFTVPTWTSASTSNNRRPPAFPVHLPRRSLIKALSLYPGRDQVCSPRDGGAVASAGETIEAGA